MSMNFCAIIASFLAYGILHLDGVAGNAGWRYVTPIHATRGLILSIISTHSWLFMIEWVMNGSATIICLIAPQRLDDVGHRCCLLFQHATVSHADENMVPTKRMVH